MQALLFVDQIFNKNESLGNYKLNFIFLVKILKIALVKYNNSDLKIFISKKFCVIARLSH